MVMRRSTNALNSWQNLFRPYPPSLFFLYVGDNYWVFDAERQIRGPESIRTLGLSASGIQAALRWGHDSTYDTYFFRSGSYWRFSPHQNRVESAYPRSMQDWSGIPNDVDASFRDIYGTKRHWCIGILDNRHMACAEAPHWVTINATYSAPLSGYAHFIRGRQYWKFDPVGMNSLEGYPRYVGVDFFGCRNAWVTLRRIRNTFPPRLFWHWRGKSRIRLTQSDETVSLTFTPNVHTHQFQYLLRKIKVCFLRLGTSCAAIHIYFEWDLGPGLRTSALKFFTIIHVLVDPPGSVRRVASACKKVDFSISCFIRLEEITFVIIC